MRRFRLHRIAPNIVRVTGVMLIIFCCRISRAETASADSPTQSTDSINGLLSKLDQQDQEIRELRSQLDDLQSATRTAPDGPLSANSAAPDAMTFQLNQRLDAIEQRLNQEQNVPPTPGLIEEDNSPDAGYEIGADKALRPSWNNGLELKSKNDDFRIHLGGLMQYDISWLDPSSGLQVSPAIGGIGPDPDSTQIRRAKLAMDGTFYEVFDFKFEFDVANDLTTVVPSAGQPVASTPALLELWVQWTHLPYLGAIRAGNQKEALGLEHVQLAKDQSFIEPSYLTDMLFGPFNNGVSPGISIINASQDQRWTWQVGVWGNAGDPFGYSIGEDWAFTGRTTYLLFYDEPSQGRYLWEVGMAGSTRTPDEGFVRMRTRGDIRSGPPGVLNPFYADTGIMQADRQNIAALETFAQWGPWSMQGEWAGTWVDNAVQPFTPPAASVSRGTPYFQGGYIEVLYFLTGDDRIFNKSCSVPGQTLPEENAYWVRNSTGGCCYGTGAWQLGVRYNAVDLNDNGINGGILNSFTLGVNWFLNPNARVQFNYDFTNRSQVKTVAAGNINGFGTRFQYNF